MLRSIEDVDGLSYDEVVCQLALFNQYCKKRCCKESCNGCMKQDIIIELENSRKGHQINLAYMKHDIDNGVMEVRE